MSSIMRVRTVISYGAGGPGFSTCYFLPATLGGSAADATNCAAAVRAFWAALAARLNNSGAAATSGQCDVINDITGALVGAFTGATPAIVPFTGAGSALPPATQILVRLNTATVINNRRIEGRTFAGPVDSNSSTNGLPVVAVGTAAAAAGAALLAVAGGALPLVWHRPGPNGPGTGVVLANATGAPYFAVLRSRRD